MSATVCPSRQVLQDVLEGRMSAEEEAAIAAHVGQCAACRTELESVAAGDRLAEPRVQKLREERVELGPAMREMLSTLGTRRPEREPRTEHWKAEKELPFLDPPDSADCIGRLGNYRVLKLLGRGGMGVVFQARDPVLGRLVAIKVLTPHLGDDAAARERFLREARAAAAINHVNVVTIYAVEEVGGLLLLVMEFVDGVSLQDRLRQRVPFSLQEVVRIGAQVAAGLAAAHARGLVHRDIKPGNILLARPADQVKIADFGLARTSEDAGVTLPGVIVGTPAYMAPEQALGQAVDHRADLFSFGSVLYALCTGRPPFSGSTTLAVVRQVADGSPASLPANSASVPPWLADTVSKLHALNPADRFQSAAEVAQLFRRQWQALRGSAPATGTGLPVDKGSPADVGGPQAASAVATNPSARAPSVLMPPPAPNRAVMPIPRPPLLRSQSLPAPPPVQWPPVQPPPAPPPAVPRLPMRGGARRYQIMAALGVLLLLLPVVLYAIKKSGGGTKAGSDAGRIGNPSNKTADLADGLPSRPTGKSTPVLSPVHVAAPPLEGPLRFAVIAPDGVTRRTFADWGAAIQGAASGDTLEIRGDGPVRIAPLHLHDKALVIRAAPGARPVLGVSRLEDPVTAPWIQSEASLVIEGLDIQCGPAEANAFLPPSLLFLRRASLRLASCRVVHRGAGPALRLEDPAACEVRNSLLHCSQGTAIDCVAAGRLRVLVENCVFSGFSGCTVHQAGPATDASLELRHNTLVLHEAIRVHLISPMREPGKGDGRTIVHIAASRNLFDTDGALLTSQLDRHSAEETERIGRLSRGESGKNAEPRWGKGLATRMNASIANIKKTVVWHSEQDLYSGSGPLLALVSSQSPQKLNALGVPDSLAGWNQYWGIAPPGISKLAEGTFDGPSLRSKAAVAPQWLGAADYRRRFPMRAAWRPLESRLEGANTALVGPGEAYAAWKNTIGYRTWVESLRPKKPDK